MAKLVFTDASVTINGVNLSNRAISVTINYGAEVIDSTTHGATAKAKLPGLTDASIDIEFAQDFAAANVDATLYSLVGAAAVPVVIRPTSAVVGAGNPSFTGSCILTSYSPISGTLNQLATTSAHLEVDGVLTRAVA